MQLKYIAHISGPIVSALSSNKKKPQNTNRSIHASVVCPICTLVMHSSIVWDTNAWEKKKYIKQIPSCDFNWIWCLSENAATDVHTISRSLQQWFSHLFNYQIKYFLFGNITKPWEEFGNSWSSRSLPTLTFLWFILNKYWHTFTCSYMQMYKTYIILLLHKKI